MTNYFAAGEGVTISGTINGDVFVFGGKTYIDGTVNGDVLAAGGQVTIDGPVSGNVRVAGGDIYPFFRNWWKCNSSRRQCVNW